MKAIPRRLLILVGGPVGAETTSSSSPAPRPPRRGATQARFTAAVPVSEVAKMATYTHAYAESKGFLTLLSDGGTLTRAG
jgi:hypothetical protein